MIYFGVIEERLSDPYKIGRCRVRVFGLHSENRADLPTQDLPWAIPIQSITSAATSGLGTSPTGMVEGSWVAIVFSDAEKQHPIIIGTLGSIPFATQTKTSQEIVDEPPVLRTDDGGVVTDGSGNPISVEDSGRPKYPQELDIQNNGETFILREEAISSLTPGRNDYRKNYESLPDSTLIYSYQDTKGIWTIGFGSTYLSNNARVDSSTVLTKGECIELARYKIKNEFVAAIKRNLSAPVTQSMFDAMVSMAYNIGYPRFIKSPMFSAVNGGRYGEASALIDSTYSKGLKNRRSAERALFDKDGYPTGEGAIEKTPDQILQQEKTHPSPPQKSFSQITSSGNGFVDPTGKFPRYTNEPDTNRLARGETISETIVARKDAARVKSVKTASGKTWRQPPVPYNATYPYNHVRMTESGHVEEFDDTKGNERLHRYHKSGTYEEIDTNGTKVVRIIGDSYEICDRDGNIYIRGNCNLTVLGDCNIRVENDYTIETLGNIKMVAGGNISMHAKQGVDITSEAGISIIAKSALTGSANGQISLDASKVNLNCGSPTDPGTIELDAAGGQIDLPPLLTPTRKAMFNASYESPDEGSNVLYLKKNAKEFDEDETEPQTGENKEESTPEEKTSNPVPVNCELLTDADIKPSYKLSTLFTLGNLLVGESGAPRGLNYGMNSQQIVCNMKKLAINILDPIKAKYPNMILTSVWRSERVNKGCGGQKTSDHLTGCAADIQLTGFTRQQHYEAIIEIQKIIPKYKQLILEYKGRSTWIHVSYKEDDLRCQNLTMDAAINKTIQPAGKFIYRA